MKSQVPYLVRPQPRFAIDEISDGIYRCRDPVGTKQRQGNLISIAIAIIDGDGGKTGRQVLASGDCIDKLRNRNQTVMRRQVFQVFIEGARRRCRLTLVVAKTMIHEDERLVAVRESK